MLLTALLWADVFVGGLSYQAYQADIPNGGAVRRNGAPWPGLGHTAAPGSTPSLNPFGTAFANAGYSWTPALCQADSDGDGQSNGLELGDPGCTWSGGATPARTTDISHPGYSDSQMGSGGATTLATSATMPATSTTAAPAVASCTPSQLAIGGGSATPGAGLYYACSLQLASGVGLHWRINESSAAVDIALVKQGTGGWLALGFPQQARQMVGGHAVVAHDVMAEGVALNGYDASNFAAISLADMRAPVSIATSGAESGQEVLRLSGVRFANTRRVDLIYGLHDGCSWPCEHSAYSGLTVDLISGTSSTEEDYDGVALLAAGLSLLALAAASVAVVHLMGAWKRLPWRVMRPGRAGCSPAGAVAILGVLACLAVAVAVPFRSNAGKEQNLILGWGVAAGLAASLPLWLAFWKAGFHSAVLLSREAAWRIHGALGAIFLACATLHGAFAIQWTGFQSIVANNFWLLGFIALLLLWLGSLPALGHSMAPKVLKYDVWKLLHMLSVCGYVLCIVHVAGQVTESKRVPLAITIINCAALAALIVQKVVVALSASRVLIDSVQVISEGANQHVILDLDAPRFKYSPGQWARLHVAGMLPVSHPFTIVPGTEQGKVRFIIKVSGGFTAALATKELQGRRAHLDGPYGLPPLPAALPWAKAAVFVLGGVGVTPALSLVAAAKSKGAAVRLFWSLRSPGLLKLCLPLLQPHMAPEDMSVQLSGVAVQEDPPTTSKPARQSIDAWLAAVAANLAAAGLGGPVLLFICGPSGMAAAARAGAAAAGKAVAGVSWCVHEEQFLFVPLLRPAPAGPAAKALVHPIREGA